MMSRKQVWRKLHSERFEGRGRESETLSVINSSNSNNNTTTNTTNTTSTTNTATSTMTSNNIITTKNKNNRNMNSYSRRMSLRDNKVRFSSIVDLVYIPSCQEYRDMSISSDLWYNDAERCKNISSVHREVQWAKGLHDKIDDKTARQILYQPLDASFKDFWKKRMFDSSIVYYKKRSGSDAESEFPMMSENKRENNNIDDLHEDISSPDNNYKMKDISGIENFDVDELQWLEIPSPNSVPKEATPLSPTKNSIKEDESFSLEEALLQDLFDFPVSFADIGDEITPPDLHSKNDTRFNSSTPIDSSSASSSVPYGISFGRTLHPFSLERNSALYRNGSQVKLGGFIWRKPNKTFNVDKSNNRSHIESSRATKKDEKMHPLAYLCS